MPFVTSLGVGAHLEAWGVPAERITELDWWESHTLPNADLTITAAPSQHFSGRGLKDRNATLWSSLVIRSAAPRGLLQRRHRAHHRVRRRSANGSGPFDLVMLEVGAFHPAWGDIHLGPENALEALALLGGGAFLPVHWGTFSLAMHAWDEPAETLLALAPAKGAQLLMPRLGEPVEPAHAPDVTPWWRAVDAAADHARAGAHARDDAAEVDAVAAGLNGSPASVRPRPSRAAPRSASGPARTPRAAARPRSGASRR